MSEAIGFSKIGWIRLAVELDHNMKQGSKSSLRHRVWIKFDPSSVHTRRSGQAELRQLDSSSFQNMDLRCLDTQALSPGFSIGCL